MTDELSPGSLIDNRYRLAARLGEGTFGEVWRAHDTRLADRAVAVKFLKSEFLDVASAVVRFEAEADALAQVQHPHVVGVFDRGRFGSRRYLVTELVDGEPLSAWIQSYRERGVFPEITAVMALFDQVCAGVDAAHAVRVPGPIVHRDLKPDNVLVRVQPNGDPLVKILDFGIAQLGGRSATRSGAFIGTPMYMAPEQGLGNTRAIGPWTDVFSLGVILVEMLTLRVQAEPVQPWWGTAWQRGASVRALLPTLRDDVPAALWDTLALALSAHGPDRPHDAGALRNALRTGRIASPAPSTTPTLASAPPAVFAPTEMRTLPAVSTTAPTTRDALPPSPRRVPVMLMLGLALCVGGSTFAWSRLHGEVPVTTLRVAGTRVESAAPVTRALAPDSVTASSYIALRERTFAPALAFDGNPATAWNEGAPGPGEGEWIQANFAQPRRVRRIRMSTGWVGTTSRGRDLFTGNSHLRRVRITFDGGSELTREVAYDQHELVIEGLDVTARAVRFEARSVWPGSQWADLALAEIALEGE